MLIELWVTSNKQLLALFRNVKAKDGVYLNLKIVFIASEGMLSDMSECLD